MPVSRTQTPALEEFSPEPDLIRDEKHIINMSDHDKKITAFG